jgi:glutathione synthase/RimK-type ligase-like ATP-grasp enzyme
VILFFGIPSEPPLALAIDAAERAGLPAIVVNQRRSHLADVALDAGCDDEGMLRIDGTTWPLSAIRSVYLRGTDPRVLPEFTPRGRRPVDPDTVERAEAFNDLMNRWFETTAVTVVNRPGAMGSNLSKPYQAQFAVRAGFLTPPTLVTNEVDEVEAFRATHGRLVYKSISSIRSIVQALSPAAESRLGLLRNLPTQFQAFIAGVNVRVHVVGTDVFATEIETDAVDYRYAARDGLPVAMRPIDLPLAVAEAAVRLSIDLGLSFTGIDLKRDPEGRWYCFEANPSPAYSYYESETGQPISEALVRYLSGQER